LGLDKRSLRRHMPRRESVGRLRPPTWSGPEGSSHNGLRRVGRLLFHPIARRCLRHPGCKFL